MRCFQFHFNAKPNERGNATPQPNRHRFTKPREGCDTDSPLALQLYPYQTDEITIDRGTRRDRPRFARNENASDAFTHRRAFAGAALEAGLLLSKGSRHRGVASLVGDVMGCLALGVDRVRIAPVLDQPSRQALKRVEKRSAREGVENGRGTFNIYKVEYQLLTWLNSQLTYLVVYCSVACIVVLYECTCWHLVCIRKRCLRWRASLNISSLLAAHYLLLGWGFCLQQPNR